MKTFVVTCDQLVWIAVPLTNFWSYLIHKLVPGHICVQTYIRMCEHLLANKHFLSFVHDSGTHSHLILEIHPCCQFSIPSLKHTSSKLLFFLNTIFISSHMYPENPKGTQVIISSVNMGYDIYIRCNQDTNTKPSLGSSSYSLDCLPGFNSCCLYTSCPIEWRLALDTRL